MSKKINRENDTVVVAPKVNKSDVALREEEVQRFWEEKEIFNKSIEKPGGGEPKGDYVFYDGPPFATGLPHYGHLLAGTIKDAVPRFWTMQGFRVRRKWGWDCHGLPLENLIEKKLGLATKRDIEDYGVKNFNEAARAAVMEYADEWRQMVPRFGRFVDMEDDYKTMDSSYTESVWWGFKQLADKGLVYEGFKSMHLCPRCGTTLSNFEVNQGYKDIKDIAVTVKLPLLDEAGEVTDVSFLVWTTTPWTLPGNLAAAVHKDFTYVQVSIVNEAGTEKVILAKERLAHLGDVTYTVDREIVGADLVGRSYQPPFPWAKAQLTDKVENAFKIYHADYVEIGSDGTGGVHLAPAYGEEDMRLAEAEGVPMIHHVDESGRMLSWVKDFAGLLVKPKDDDKADVSHLDTDIEVVKKLKELGVLFKKENITHSYPHCWRCDTPLLNYATTSWFVRVTDLKDKLVAENSKVHWVPGHVGANRFGKWLEGARDWAVSRQRYWGAPLPIWKQTETGEVHIFGSQAEIRQRTKVSGNTYTLMRHAEAESNLKGVICADKNYEDNLTSLGLEQAATAAANLSATGKKIDVIIHSGFLRTKKTAEIIASTLGVSSEAVVADERIVELQAGKDLEGKSWNDFADLFGNRLESYSKTIEGVENRRALQKRAGDFLYDLETRYQGKNILVVAHAGVLFALESVARGLSPEESVAYFNQEGSYFKNAEVRDLDFVPLPHNDDYVLDYHRPYIDELLLVDESGAALERVPDVFDCWFESGSMPFAETNYPFANLDITNPEKDVRFPANFISESIDQTRGWFYSLLVLGVGIFDRAPFKNVITNGLVLAEDGKKMSKSLQNYPDPVELVDKVGADAVRYYLLSSPIIRGEDLNFSEKEVTEQMRKNLGRLHNVLLMYQLYPAGKEVPLEKYSPDHILDRWLNARLFDVVSDITEGYEKYELDKATRPLADFIDDLSVWYLRRSRDRLKSEDVEVQQEAAAALRYFLRQLALLMAPVMPFYADYLWQSVKYEDDQDSVHLSAWPKVGKPDDGLLEDMSALRRLVTEALQCRTKAGIKVRQPLGGISVDHSLSTELQEILCDEVNVKYVTYKPGQKESVVLDTKLTAELIGEGAIRELMRAIQDLRKQNDLTPSDRIKVMIGTVEAGADLIDQYKPEIKRVVGADEITIYLNESVEGVIIETTDYSFAVAIGY